MFNNAGHALDWAYNTAGKPIVKMSGINNMRQAQSRGAENPLLINLSAYDKHGQAAAIISMVDRLADQAAREYITARFGRRVGQDDLRVLIYRGCEATGLGLSKKDIVYRVMQGYFVGGVGYRAIQKMLGCRNDYALMVKSCLYDVLDTYHDRAMSDMTEIFERKGLIESRGLLPVGL